MSTLDFFYEGNVCHADVPTQFFSSPNLNMDTQVHVTVVETVQQYDAIAEEVPPAPLAKEGVTSTVEQSEVNEQLEDVTSPSEASNCLSIRSADPVAADSELGVISQESVDGVLRGDVFIQTYATAHLSFALTNKRRADRNVVVETDTPNGREDRNDDQYEYLRLVLFVRG